MLTLVSMSNQIIDPSIWRAKNPFIIMIDVMPEDIDDFKHVNNVVYIGWMSRVAWAHSKALGFDFARYQELDCGFVVRRHEIDYRQACLPGETVAIATWVTQNDGRMYLRRRFQMVGTKSLKTLAYGMSDFVSMKISTGKACRMPEAFKAGYPAAHAVEDSFSVAKR